MCCSSGPDRGGRYPRKNSAQRQHVLPAHGPQNKQAMAELASHRSQRSTAHFASTKLRLTGEGK